jgi:hypothetical protein
LKNINSSQPRFIGQAGKGIAVRIKFRHSLFRSL